MNLDTLNWIDVALGGILIISALIGLMRGFVKEILSLIAWGVAAYAAWMLAEPVAKDYVSRVFNDEKIAYIAALGAIFIGTLFLIGVVNLLISQVLKMTGLGFLDRLLGLILGTVRGVLIGALITFAALLFSDGHPENELPSPLNQQWGSSVLAPYYKSAAQWGYDQIAPTVDSWIQDKLKKQGRDQKKPETANADNGANPAPAATLRPSGEDVGILKSPPATAPAVPQPEEPTLHGLESAQ